jgi:hypothetical protein
LEYLINIIISKLRIKEDLAIELIFILLCADWSA